MKFLDRTPTKSAINDSDNNTCSFVMLGHGKYCLIDNEDIHLLGKYRWHYNLRGYAARWARLEGKNKLIYLHRLISGAKDGVFCDHINHDKLDNRKCNLRLCDKSQNLCNVPKKKWNGKATSRFKGVCWDSSRGKFLSQIGSRGKNLFIGRFQSEKDAAIAYNQAAIEYHGEFANLNNIT